MRCIINPFDILPFWRGNTRNLADLQPKEIEQNTLAYASIGYSLGLTGVATPCSLDLSEQAELGKAKKMTEVKATAMATSIAKDFNITREAAFDAILATAAELGATGSRYSEKLAAEIEAAIFRDIAETGTPAKLNRPVISA